MFCASFRTEQDKPHEGKEDEAADGRRATLWARATVEKTREIKER